jgi:hypothetical protein
VAKIWCSTALVQTLIRLIYKNCRFCLYELKEPLDI